MALKLEEFSDRELLHRFNDLADDEGWVDTRTFAEALKIRHPNPLSCVGARFAWMARFGVIERDGRSWRLTDVGRAVLGARLNATTVRSLEAVKPEQAMDAMLALGGLYAGIRDAPEGHLMRRAWRYRAAR